MSEIIMSWSKCTVDIGKTGAKDAMAETLESIGKTKDKQTTLEPSDGESLEAKASGGELVARAVTEGGFTLKTRVIEPSNDLYEKLGLGKINETSGDFDVKSHIVSGIYSVKVTPSNIGAKGIKVPKTMIAFKPGYSEEEGQYADLEFYILKTTNGLWYSRFTNKGVEPESKE